VTNVGHGERNETRRGREEVKRERGGGELQELKLAQDRESDYADRVDRAADV
jgi:hypothetical protein